MQKLIERLRKIKELETKLNEEKRSIVEKLPERFVYKSDKPEDSEKPYIKFTKTDNFKTIEENGIVWKSTKFSRYSTEIRALKNEPKGE